MMSPQDQNSYNAHSVTEVPAQPAIAPTIGDIYVNFGIAALALPLTLAIAFLFYKTSQFDRSSHDSLKRQQDRLERIWQMNLSERDRLKWQRQNLERIWQKKMIP